MRGIGCAAVLLGVMGAATAQTPVPAPRPEIAAPPLAAPAGPEITPADWQTVDETDRITGKRNIRVYTVQNTTTLRPNRRSPQFARPGALAFQCEGGRLAVYFYVHGELVASYRQIVQYRIDERPPVTTRAWVSSTDSSAVGLWNHAAAVRLAKSLEDAQRIIIRIQHDAFGQTEGELRLGGLASALAPVREACRLR